MPDTLAELRADIDEIDRDMVALLARRFAVVHRVAVVKAREGLAAVLPERVAQVKRQARALAEDAGINPDLVEQIYGLIIDEACRTEEEFLRNAKEG